MKSQTIQSKQIKEFCKKAKKMTDSNKAAIINNYVLLMPVGTE